MSIDRFEVTKMSIEGMVVYKTIRKEGENIDDMVEFFNIVKNQTDAEMKQINVSRSGLNVIRGVHVAPYHKVVFCPSGKIFDVCVDLRPNSPTFMKWEGVWLDKDTYVIIPAYCAHGVFSAEEDSCLCYYQGGCYFPQLDFAVNPMDEKIGIKWPAPINSDHYVLSEKDTKSEPVTDELIEKLKYRIEHPIEDRHENTNSDVVIVSNKSEYALPICKAVETLGLKGHLLAQTSFKRETLNARLYSLRPKYSVIYVLDTHGKNCLDIFTEVMNAAEVCNELGHHITIVSNTDEFAGKEEIVSMIDEECKEFATFIVCKTLLSRNMTKAGAATFLKQNEQSLAKVATITDLDACAEVIVKMGMEKKTGIQHFGNKGKIEVAGIKDFCKENGIDFNAEQGEAYEGCEHSQDANEAFKDIISHLK